MAKASMSSFGRILGSGKRRQGIQRGIGLLARESVDDVFHLVGLDQDMACSHVD